MNTDPKNSEHMGVPDQVQVVAAEYKALRDEILKRTEFRYQLINLTLVSAGTLLATGVHESSASILFVYPILGAFLAAGWTHNGNAVVPIVHYIREELERKNSGLGWETYLETHARQRFLYDDLGLVYAAGIFLSTQLIALILGLLKTTSTPIEIVLLAGDILAIALTAIMLFLSRRAKTRS